MKLETWPQRDPAGKATEENAVSFSGDEGTRVLVLPAWFDEANKLRHFTLAVMRALASQGIASVLPDLPGCNESLAPLEDQTIAFWREAAGDAAAHFEASHVLAIRAGALIAPPDLPGWHYAPTSGSKLLSALLRAQVFAAREVGRPATRESLLEEGRQHGLVLGGWQLGSEMVRALEVADVVTGPEQSPIDQSVLGGPGLWLRAEPAHDAAQAGALAAIIAAALTGETPQ